MNHVLRFTEETKAKELNIIPCRRFFSDENLYSSLESSTYETKIDAKGASDHGDTLFYNPSQRAHLFHAPVVGVIFDMDGTLTEPGAINFAAMYERIGLTKGKGDIIHWCSVVRSVC
jgi:hypothetical protein